MARTEIWILEHGFQSVDYHHIQRELYNSRDPRAKRIRDQLLDKHDVGKRDEDWFQFVAWDCDLCRLAGNHNGNLTRKEQHFWCRLW